MFWGFIFEEDLLFFFHSPEALTKCCFASKAPARTGCGCRGTKGILHTRHKIALWTETRTGFRKEEKYICVLEKRIQCMKCIKTALAPTPWRIRRSRDEAPTACMPRFSASYTHCAQYSTRKRPGLHKSSCLASAVPALCTGRERPLRRLSAAPPWGAALGIPFPHSMDDLTVMAGAVP